MNVKRDVCQKEEIKCFWDGMDTCLEWKMKDWLIRCPFLKRHSVRGMGKPKRMWLNEIKDLLTENDISIKEIGHEIGSYLTENDISINEIGHDIGSYGW